MPADPQSTVVGVFDNHNSAQQAVQELQRAGFRDAHMREEEGQWENDTSGEQRNRAEIDHERTHQHTLVVLTTADRQQEARDILHRYGATDQDSDTASTQNGEAPGTHLEYDPITGPKEVPNAPLAPGGYGQRRDPSVETQAEAKTYYTGQRPDPALTDGSADTSFERPLAPGTTSPGSLNDPNDQLPIVP